MIRAGTAGLLAIANEKTDHLWIVLTDEAQDSLAVIVMLTDARNLEEPSILLEAGKPLIPQLSLTKRSTIDCARARKLDWSTLNYIVSGPNFAKKGVVSASDLTAIRDALLISRDTPVDVLEYCRVRA